MSDKLAGQVVLVTGAARGQGRAHAIAVAAEGAHVIAVDICAPVSTVEYEPATQSDLDRTVEMVAETGQRAIPVICDVRDAEGLRKHVDDAVSEFGRLDAAVANAGISVVNNAQDISPEEWANVIGVNLTGAFNTAQAAIPHLIDGGRGGSIIFTSSATVIRPVPGMAHYIASKHGITGLCRALARELAHHQIRVNIVQPTNCDTTMIQNPVIWGLFAPDVENPTREDVVDAFKSMAALDTPWVSPSDVSKALVFLLSDDARFTTGTELQVTAGYNVM